MTMMIALASLFTLAALAGLLWPILRPQRPAAARRDCDAKVYRDQLAEIERDLDRGLLSPDQATAVRTEIQRRLLAVMEEGDDAPAAKPPRRWATALALLILVPAGAAGLYLHLGARLPDRPFASRQSDPEFQMAAMVERLATGLKSDPTADGYATLAASLIHLKRYDEAIDAYRQAIRLGAIDGDMLSSLGEALVLSQDGMVGPDARQAFQHALMLDAVDPRARFYLGLSDAQAGRTIEAVSVWRDLERSSAADAPWLPMLQEHIREYAKMAGVDPASVAPMSPKAAGPAADGRVAAGPAMPPPSGDQAAAIMKQSPEEQARTIRSMVDGLAARLEREPGDKAGWQRLAGAYRVLGEVDKAKAAEEKARAIP